MLPQDPAILLSYVNTKLRDCYPSLAALCDDLQADEQAHGVLAVGGIQFHDNLVGQAADSRSDTAGCRQVDFTVGSNLACLDDGNVYFSHETIAYFLRHL